MQTRIVQHVTEKDNISLKAVRVFTLPDDVPEEWSPDDLPEDWNGEFDKNFILTIGNVKYRALGPLADMKRIIIAPLEWSMEELIDFIVVNICEFRLSMNEFALKFVEAKKETDESIERSIKELDRLTDRIKGETKKDEDRIRGDKPDEQQD